MAGGESSIRIYVVSDVGRVRKENQDSYFVGPHPKERLDSHGTLILVADGMGGHAAGSVASTIAVETIFSSYYTEVIGREENPAKALSRSFRSANLTIIEAGRRDHRHFGMGTTCSALLMRGDLGWIAHVGDSRIYRYRDGELERLTRDHTLLQQMLDRGEVKAEEAEGMPIRHILVRAMGSEDQVEVDCTEEPFALVAGDRFLLSSDGLHDVIAEDAIGRILETHTGDEAVEALSAAADAAGAPDNVTAVLIELVPVDNEDEDV